MLKASHLALPPKQRIHSGDNCLSSAALVPPQVTALVEPLDRVVVEHAGEQGADDGPWIVSVAAPNSSRPNCTLDGSLVHRDS